MAIAGLSFWQRFERPLVNSNAANNRFWTKVDQSGGPDACWPWTGGHNDRGAGIAVDPETKKMAAATRVLWRMEIGPIPDGIQVLHRCDNPPCVNPAHLFLGTRADNMRDMMAKGRARQGRTAGGPWLKLTPDKVMDIRLLVAAGAPIRAIAREYKVWPSAIRSALKREASRC